MAKRVFDFDLTYSERELDVPDGASDEDIIRLFIAQLDPELDFTFDEVDTTAEEGEG